MRIGRLSALLPCLSVYIALAGAAADASEESQAGQQSPLKAVAKPASYRRGQSVPVTCLERTAETGEHISDARGALQYVPFPTCNETGRPLELPYRIDKDLNCTIDFISDPFFHLLEFYVHNDVPLSCRLPTRPLADAGIGQSSVPSSPATDTEYVPLVIALSGALQLSHLHIANSLNVLVHTARVRDGADKLAASSTVIDTAGAYSVSIASRSQRVIIGDSLTLHFSVRWLSSAELPRHWSGGVHDLFSLRTMACCAFSALVTAGICSIYVSRMNPPRRPGVAGRYRSLSTQDTREYSGYGYRVGKRD